MVLKQHRRGMTLLELILALSISVIIMLAIGMAIHLHMKTLQTRRTNVEEAQLARQVLRRMADDLRSAVQYQVIDFSSIEKMAAGGMQGLASNALQGAAGMEDETGLNASLFEGLMSTPVAGEEEAAAATSIAGSASPPAIPGLYGNQYELQIDVSRLPRIDEYQVMVNPLSGQTVTDIPSDVKTVAYYLQPDTLATATTSTLNDPTTSERVRATGAVGRGLVRRELDRAVSLWASENNNVDDLATQGEMLAMEVTGLEFRYFDGTEWLTEWNSEERQGLPVAVAIAVEIGGDADSSADDGPGASLLEPTTAAAATPGAAPDPMAMTNRLLYRLVVHLPASEATSADTARFPATTASEDPATSGAAEPAPQDNADQGADGSNQGGGGGQGGGGRPGQGSDQGGGGPGGGGRPGRGGQGGGGRPGPGRGGGSAPGQNPDGSGGPRGGRGFGGGGFGGQRGGGR